MLESPLEGVEVMHLQCPVSLFERCLHRLIAIGGLTAVVLQLWEGILDGSGSSVSPRRRRVAELVMECSDLEFLWCVGSGMRVSVLRYDSITSQLFQRARIGVFLSVPFWRI